MCVLYACYEKVPSKTLMEESEAENLDGIGIAWLEGDHVRWEKGIPDLGKAEALLKKIKLPFLIHFRKASSGMGPKNPYLTHPFPVTEGVELSLKGTAQAVLAHNGFWKDWNGFLLRSALGSEWKIPRRPWSDSRALALLYKRHGPGLFDLLDLDDRILVMDASLGDAPFLTFGNGWLKKDGFWQSQEVKKKTSTSSHEAWAQHYSSSHSGSSHTKSGGGSASPLALVATTPPIQVPKNAFGDEELTAILGELRAHISVGRMMQIS